MLKYNKKNEKDEFFRSWFFLCVVSGFMVCIFAPLETFFTNESEFWFTITQLLSVLLIVYVLFVAIFLGIGVLIGKSKRKIEIYSFLLSSMLYFYIQGNFVPRNYGVLDGKKIDWDSYTVYGIVSILLLIFFFVLWIFAIIKLKNNIVRHGKNICIYIALIQIITLSTLFIQNNILQDNQKKDIVVTDEGCFNLSKNQNIVIFVLDAFDSSYLNDVLKSDVGDDYREILSDFTYYPDTLGGYPTTKASMPLILTGVRYENDIPYSDYIEGAYKNNEIYSTLRENNYSVGIYTEPLYFSAENEDYINITRGNYAIDNYGMFIKEIYKLVAFNYMPHQLKRFFFTTTADFDELKKADNNQSIFSLDTEDFYKDMSNKEIILDDERAFRLYHIDGVHPPYTFGENMDSQSGMEYDVYDEVYGNIFLIQEYIKKLKEKNIYDDTTIIIMADHGQIGRNQNPIFMIKNTNEIHDSLQISDAKMSWDYLENIFVSLVKGSIIDQDFIIQCANEGKERRFLYYSWDDSGNRQYMPTMSEYYLTKDGDASNLDDLIQSNRFFIAEKERKKYDLGETLVFSESQTIDEYCSYGISYSESWGAWTDGNEACMVFDIDGDYQNLLLKMNVAAYMPPQNVKVFANENCVAEFSVCEAEEREIIIPKEYLKEGVLYLRFELPNAVSPISLGESIDGRKLALALTDLVIVSTDKTASSTDNTIN